MAIVSRMASDLTGKEGEEREFATLVIREHPALDEPKAFDVLPAEIAGLKSTEDLVVCEVRNADSSTTQIVVPLAEFRKVIKDDVLAKGRNTRGRRPGFSPSANGNGRH